MKLLIECDICGEKIEINRVCGEGECLNCKTQYEWNEGYFPKLTEKDYRVIKNHKLFPKRSKIYLDIKLTEKDFID